jgi:predicted DNA-binding transcriptional regulator AlpA
MLSPGSETIQSTMTNVSVNLRPSEAAAYLRLSISTLAKWRLSGSGPPYSKVGRAVVYRRHDLDSWLDARQLQNTSQTLKI